jgi:P27 family predicted phage terminase small subunit
MTQVGLLSPEAKRLLDRLKKQWGIDEEPGLTIALTLCQSLDRLRQAQEILRQDGLIIRITRASGQVDVKAHPAAKIEQDARAHVLQCAKALNLDLETLEE